MDIERKNREVDFMDYWRIILKRKWVIVTFAGALIFFTAVFTFLATPKYRSTATMLIEEESTKMLSIDETFGFQSPMVQDLRFFNTQLKLLRSRSLAERVARKMNLLSRPEFNPGNRKSIFSALRNILTFKWLRSGADSNGEERAPENAARNAYSMISNSIRQKVEVDPIRETKLVEISFTSSNAKFSSDLVNTLAEEFIDFSIEKRLETTQMASDFLSEQIDALKEDLNSKERELQRYGQEKDLLYLSDSESSAVNNFANLYDAYTQAQIDRVNAQANYLAIQNLDVDALPDFVNNPTIQQLNADYKRLKSDFEEKSQTFRSSHPEMISLQARLDSMKQELLKAVEATEQEYRAALRRERSLKGLVDSQTEDLAEMNSNAIRYNNLKIDVENKRSLLRTLTERQNETMISSRLSGLRASNITIIDRGEISRFPVSPRKKLNLVLSLVFGLFGGVGLCFLLEYLDNTIKGAEDVERLSRLPSLGIVSYLPEDRMPNKEAVAATGGDGMPENSIPELNQIELINHIYPKLFISEDYRTIRTSLMLSNTEVPKSVVFTSAMPKEGKTSTVVNLAVAFAQLEFRVLLIDADLRKPRIHRIFNISNGKGLSGYLTNKTELGDAIQTTSIENIWALPSGLIPPNPAELLNSRRMKDMMKEVEQQFDIVLVDTPPVLAVIDPVITASIADATAFVIRAGHTTSKSFMGAVEELNRAKIGIVGVIFNEVRVGKGGYNYMSYYNYARESYYIEDRS